MFVAASFSSNVSTSLFVYSGALSSSLGTFFIGTGSILCGLDSFDGI